MLDGDRTLEVEDGSYVHLDGALQVGRPDFLSIRTPAGTLRTLYRDQGVLSVADADGLVAAGLAGRVGDRLFERPELSERIFDWDSAAEIDFIAGQVDGAEPGLEYGCGTGRILLPLLDRGLTVDGIDASEPAVRWLRRQPAAGPARLHVADIAGWSAPDAYGWVVAGLNTLRYLPSVPALRRHLHLAAVSVRAGGRYVLLVDTWTDEGLREPAGSAGEWTAGTGADELRIVWTKVRSDPLARLDLESVVVHRGGTEVFREHQTQLALSLADWRGLFEERGEWRVRSVQVDGVPAPVELSGPAAGNIWFVLERTDHTAEPIFTR